MNILLYSIISQTRRIIIHRFNHVFNKTKRIIMISLETLFEITSKTYRIIDLSMIIVYILIRIFLLSINSGQSLKWVKFFLISNLLSIIRWVLNVFVFPNLPPLDTLGITLSYLFVLLELALRTFESIFAICGLYSGIKFFKKMNFTFTNKDTTS